MSSFEGLPNAEDEKQGIDFGLFRVSGFHDVGVQKSGLRPQRVDLLRHSIEL